MMVTVYDFGTIRDHLNGVALMLGAMKMMQTMLHCPRVICRNVKDKCDKL